MDASQDPRIASHLDILADLAYARLLSAARARGLGVLVVPSDCIDREGFEQFKQGCAEILAELLDRAGVFVALEAA